MRPRFLETHIFLTCTVPFYTPLEVVFHKGFQLWGGAGGGGHFCKVLVEVCCHRPANPSL